MLSTLALLAALTMPVDSLPFSGRLRQLEVGIPRVENPEVRIDGDLDEAVWAQAALLSDFTQYEPVEGVVPEEGTEVRAFYAADAIYFGIRALDPHPDQILARLGERDKAVFGDDWVRIMLDTFNDQRRCHI